MGAMSCCSRLSGAAEGFDVASWAGRPLIDFSETCAEPGWLSAPGSCCEASLAWRRSEDGLDVMSVLVVIIDGDTRPDSIEKR